MNVQEIYLAHAQMSKRVSELLADCEAGGGSSCFDLAMQSSDVSDKIHFFRKACDAAFAPGCYKFRFSSTFFLDSLLVSNYHNLSLGVCYGRGLGVPKDVTEQRKLVERSCELAMPAACNVLSEMMMVGEGGEKNVGKALMLMRQMCEIGSPQACYNLGMIAGSGKMMAPNRILESEMMKRACDLGHEQGCLYYRMIVAKLKAEEAAEKK